MNKEFDYDALPPGARYHAVLHTFRLWLLGGLKDTSGQDMLELVNETLDIDDPDRKAVLYPSYWFPAKMPKEK